MSIPAALARRREYAGPALFSFGFRPFFLGGALWAAFGVLLWLPQYFSELALKTHFAALDWHIHEMLFGYAAAVVAGFLLTAIPNWTGRLPVCGAPLAALALLWLAGRLVLLVSAQIGGLVAAIIDTSFLMMLAAVATREVVAGRNWRNLRVLAMLGVLILGNVVFHAEVLLHGAADYGIRIGIAAMIGLITLIGGRIVPSFTNNWLVRNRPGRLPIPFSRFDVVAVAMSAIALIAWIAMPMHTVAGVLLVAAGVLQFARLARWAGDRTTGERLVLILHVGYLFVPVGFLLTGLSKLWNALPQTAGIHAWTAGAIGIMTLAVMTRASLGHTGRPLTATAGTQLIYACALVAVLTRIAAAFNPAMLWLHVSATAWVLAFGGFAVLYGPLLGWNRPAWQSAHR